MPPDVFAWNTLYFGPGGDGNNHDAFAADALAEPFTQTERETLELLRLALHLYRHIVEFGSELCCLNYKLYNRPLTQTQIRVPTAWGIYLGNQFRCLLGEYTWEIHSGPRPTCVCLHKEETEKELRKLRQEREEALR